MKRLIEYPDIVPLLKLFRQNPDNIVGGYLHIFLEDGNVHDDHIKFCQEWCIEPGNLLGEAICRLALKMSITQRKRMSREFYEL
jgi:hypothetical protein